MIITHRRKIQRSAEEGIPGNLVRVQDAGFVSLVKKPANQRGFSVMRSDAEEGQNEMSKVTAPMVRRTRTNRSDDTANLAAVDFPTGYSRDQVDAALTSFGLASYTVTETSGVFRAQRSDLKSVSNEYAPVKLTEDGVVAHVKRSDNAPAATSGQVGLKLVAMEFDAKTVQKEDAIEYLTRNSVDFSESDLDNSANGDTVLLKRAEVEEGQEVRRIEIEAGVVAVVTRADANDIPEGFIAVICEEAYGNWGWGQLDFAAAVADEHVSEQLREGLRRLDDVLRNILFYSPLGIDARKALVSRSLNQYADFANGLLDSLPRQVLVAVGAQIQRSDKAHDTTQEITDMTTAKADAAKQKDAGEAITRSDLDAFKDEMKDLLKEGIGGAVAALKRGDAPAGEGKEEDDPAKEGDEGKEGGDKEVETEVKEAPADGVKKEAIDAAAITTSKVDAITRSDLDTFKDEIKGLLTETLKTNTVAVVRSDSHDPQRAEEKEGKKVQRSAEAVFTGTLFNRK